MNQKKRCPICWILLKFKDLQHIHMESFSSYVPSLISRLKKMIFHPYLPKMPSLKLTMEEDDFGINHFLDKTFYLLRDFLQPDTNLTLDITTQSILDSLSKQDAKSQETSLFGDLCVQLAERIPYHHASLMKMVALLERLAEPTKFTTANAMGEYLKFSGFGIDFRDALHGRYFVVQTRKDPLRAERDFHP